MDSTDVVGATFADCEEFSPSFSSKLVLSSSLVGGVKTGVLFSEDPETDGNADFVVVRADSPELADSSAKDFCGPAALPKPEVDPLYASNALPGFVGVEGVAGVGTPKVDFWGPPSADLAPNIGVVVVVPGDGVGVADKLNADTGGGFWFCAAFKKGESDEMEAPNAPMPGSIGNALKFENTPADDELLNGVGEGSGDEGDGGDGGTSADVESRGVAVISFDGDAGGSLDRKAGFALEGPVPNVDPADGCPGSPA